MNALQLNEKSGLLGSVVVRSHTPGQIKYHKEGGKTVVDPVSLKEAMKSPLYEHPKVSNLVVSSDGYGRNLILRQLSRNVTYGIAIDTGAIGTGNTAPVDGNTDLQTPVLAGITVGLFELTNDVLIVSFFIPDGDLANGTYKEFGTFIDERLFSRAIISPDYTKGAGIDTTIEYTFTFST